VQQRPDRRRLVAAVIVGYLGVWAGFGIGAHLLDAAVHKAARHSDWLIFNGCARRDRAGGRWPVPV
jgi:predicted metal-binding membrane protein